MKKRDRERLEAFEMCVEEIGKSIIDRLGDEELRRVEEKRMLINIIQG